MMLTGDHELSAMRIAKIVGIDEVYCCLKPEEKLNRVKTTSRDRGNYNFGCVYFAASVQLLICFCFFFSIQASFDKQHRAMI